MTDNLAEEVRRTVGFARLARELNVTRQAVSDWFKGRVPAERVLEIERATGVSRHRIRPDLYPEDTSVEPPDAEPMRAS